MSENWQFANKSLSYIMQYAVVTPAPEFFLSHIRITMIRTHLKLGHFDEEGRLKMTPAMERYYERRRKEKERLDEIRKTLQKEGLVPSS